MRTGLLRRLGSGTPSARAPEGGPSSGALTAFRGATFLSALLLFLVQLISAKGILPRFGGAPAVWTTCMLFFQALLLLGYAYAHASARHLAPRTQAVLHLVLLALALLTMPIVPRATESIDGPPVLQILVLLARSVGLPCFVLSASSPLFQAWAARAPGASPGDSRRSGPYRLYALSNAGSLLALFAYPALLEPWLPARAQELAWSAAFAVFALLGAWCARVPWLVAAGAPHEEATALAATAPALRERFLWLALPACASTLLLAATNQMCQEVAVVPLLWVVPLGLYLLSFLLTFADDRWYGRVWCLPILTFALAVMAQATGLGARAGIAFGVPVYSLGLFVCCLFCHGELAARRPAPRHLTAYYLLIALGGVLGGAFVSLVSPLVFRGYDEMYVGLLACGALAVAVAWNDPAFRRRSSGAWHPLVPSLVVVVALVGLALGVRLLARAQPGLTELRSFHGTMRIEELPAPDGAGRVRYLTHGGTRHGQQFLLAEKRREPTTYFGRASGIGILLGELSSGPPLRVGIIGLGAGVLAAYGRAGDTYRFYELDPLVIEVARRDFTFLGDSPATIELVPGDARLSLELEQDERFDVLVLDAFSSDAIPVHLLTREAFALYERHLAPDGVLALHVTTRHLDLGPLLEAQACGAGRLAWEILSAKDDARGLLDARWVLLGVDDSWATHAGIRAAGHRLGERVQPIRPWTDDYSNLLAVLE
jgi:SAM-dependent methyltransferase